MDAQLAHIGRDLEALGYEVQTATDHLEVRRAYLRVRLSLTSEDRLHTDVRYGLIGGGARSQHYLRVGLGATLGLIPVIMLRPFPHEPTSGWLVGMPLLLLGAVGALSLETSDRVVEAIQLQARLSLVEARIAARVGGEG